MKEFLPIFNLFNFHITSLAQIGIGWDWVTIYETKFDIIQAAMAVTAATLAPPP